jgi:integrase
VRKTVDKFGNESSTKGDAGDSFAVQKLLGHADVKMATTYV